MTAIVSPTVAPPSGARRLLLERPTAHHVDHVARIGYLPRTGPALIDEVERAGLRGRGGAGFPTAVKMRAVRTARGTATVVANGTEGEPLSAKDKTLLVHAPHLVLDGAVAAAEAVGARDVVVCVDRHATPAVQAMERALDERRRASVGRVSIRLAATPARYIAGEETALVHWLNGGDAKPTFTPPRPFERGVANRPTLVDNVETLAHIALIARFGAQWWRSAGTEADPGTMLVTVNGVDRPGVYEVPLGSSLRDVIRNAGAHDVTGVLVGGYFGTWITPRQAALVTLSVDDMKAIGAGLGCGALAVLGSHSCPLAEIARVTRWLANQSAGQCGPCALGLPAIADAVEHVASGADRDRAAETAAYRWLDMVAGRGACKLPDGAVRFVTSGFRVYADHVTAHRTGGPCNAFGTPAVLPVPAPESAWR